MKCPYCNKFKGNSKVKGYTVREQLHRHIEVAHTKDRTNIHEWGSPKGLPKGWRGRILS